MSETEEERRLRIEESEEILERLKSQDDGQMSIDLIDENINTDSDQQFEDFDSSSMKSVFESVTESQKPKVEIVEAEDDSLLEGEADEDVIQMTEDPSILKDLRDAAYFEYSNEITNTLTEFGSYVPDDIQIQGEDAIREYYEKNPSKKLDAQKEIDKYLKSRQFIVGDQPGEGLYSSVFGARTTSLFKRVDPVMGTVPLYQDAARVAREKQGEPLYARAYQAITEDLPDELKIKPEALEASGIMKDGQFVDTDGTILGVKITNERLLNFVGGVSAAGAVYGGVKGGIAGSALGPAGAVGGAIGGALLAGAGFTGLSSGVAAVAKGISTIPEEYSKSEYLLDLAKRGFTVFGTADDLADFLLIQSNKARNFAVLNIVESADAVGVKDLAKFLDKHEIIDFEALQKKTEESLFQHQNDLMKDQSDRYTGTELGFATITSAIMGVQIWASVFQNSEIKNEFLLDLMDIRAQVLNTTEFQEARSIARQEMLEQKRYDLNIRSRNQKPTIHDYTLITPMSVFRDGLITEQERNNQINENILHISYNQLHPSLRKNQPDLEEFKQIASSISKTDSFLTKDILPHVPLAISMVHEKAPDEQIQNVLNAIPFSLFATQKIFEDVTKDSIPTEKELLEFSANQLKFLDSTGAKATRHLERQATPLFLKRVESGESSVYLKRSILSDAMNLFTMITTAGAEASIGISDETLEGMFGDEAGELLENLGVPGGLFLPTSAGLDFMMQLGIRDVSDDFLTRFEARLDSGLGGFQIGNAEIAAALGSKPGDPLYNLLQNIGMGMDMLLNLEKRFFSFTGGTARILANSRNARRAFVDAKGSKTTRYAAAKEMLFEGVVQKTSSDPLVRLNTIFQAALNNEKNRGKKLFESLSKAEQENVRRLLRNVERDPEIYIAADVVSSNDVQAIQKVASQLIKELGPNEVVAFRMSGAYKRIEVQTQRLVNDGLIEASDRQQFLALIELQAFKIAEANDTVFSSPVEVIQNLAVVRNRAAGKTARFQLDGNDETPSFRITLEDKSPNPDVRFAKGKGGVPLGYFEYDPITKRSFINLFNKGDINTLWHENGHFMAALMGDDFNQKIFQHFDHTVNPQGLKILTDLGQEQFADAWSTYRNLKSAKNGHLRRLFGELFVTLQRYYSKIRNKPALLPDAVKRYWDVEFGVLASDRRKIDVLTHKVVTKRPRAVFVSPNKKERVAASRPARIGREKTATEGSMEPRVLHAYLGDKLVTKVDVEVDPDTGQTNRFTRRVYQDKTEDPVQVLIKAIAYVKTQKYANILGQRKYAQLGTNRFIVPLSKLPQILDNVKQKMIDMTGDFTDNLDKKLYQIGQDGFVDRSNVPSFIKPSDFAAFDKRQRMNNPGPDALVDRNTRQTEFFALASEEAAGFQTLLQEISQSPLSDVLPKGLLDPEANLKILSVNEYQLIRKVMEDIEANPINRAHRGTVHPGFTRRLAMFLSEREGTKEIGNFINAQLKLVTREKLRFNKTNTNPDLIDVFERQLRREKRVQEDLVKEVEHARKNGADHFVNFYVNQVGLFIPPVALSKVSKLFELVSVFKSQRTGMTQDQLAKMRGQQAKQGVPSRVIPDVITSKSGTLDINYILNNLVEIQDLLDGPTGMTRLERQSMRQLRTLKNRGVKNQNITDQDQMIFSDALQTIQNGLLEKYNRVQNETMDVFKIALGKESETITFDFNDQQILSLYKAYYKGDLLTMYDIAQAKSLKSATMDSYTKTVVDKTGKKTKVTKPKTLFSRAESQEQDAIALLTNVLVYGKVSELRRTFAKELAEAGYRSNRRALYEEIAGRADLGEYPNLDRSKYIERITFFINQELKFQDRVVIATGTKQKKPELLAWPRKAPKETRGEAELQPGLKNHPDTQIVTFLDKSAKDEASKILDSMGIRRELGQFNMLRLGDDTFLLPESMIIALEENLAETFNQPTFKRNFGKNGSVEYALLDDVTGKQITLKREVIDAVKRLVEIAPLNPKVFYNGLLIGSGGVPMVPYLASVHFGAATQVQLGQGLSAAAKDFVAFPGTITEAVSSYKTMRETNFVAGTLARTFGDGKHKPPTKPYITKDGRIITADGMNKAIIDEGVKGSFINTINTVSLHEKVLEVFSKSNPWVGGSVIGGTIGALLGGLTAGPVGAVAAGSALAGTGGITLGAILKRGGLLSRLNRTYGEAATAIDSFYRIRIMLREIESGKSMREAARIARDIAMDYSDVSEFEKNVLTNMFAFYTYFKQATKLVVKTAIENPDRLITQIKIARATQLKVTDLEDPERVLSSWDRTRFYLPGKVGSFGIRMPYGVGADVISLGADFFGSLPFIQGPDQAQKSRLALLARANPMFLEFLYKPTTGLDPGRGFALNRATNQVPALLVQLDHDIFGGSLHDFLGIYYIPDADLKKRFDEKTGRRVNIKNLEMPGRGIYISTKPLRSSLILNFFQTPVTGRFLGLIEAIDRSNIGLTETLLRISDAYYQADTERPLLARIPGLVELGVVKPTRRFTYGVTKTPGALPTPVMMQRPTDQGDPNIAPGIRGYLDTATAHRYMREEFSYTSNDGIRYNLKYRDFYPLYLLKLIGVSAVHIDKEGSRQAAYKLKKSIQSMKKTKSE